MSADNYGRYYWCIGVPKDICPKGQIYAHADRVEVKDGVLCLLFQREGAAELVNLSFAPSQWRYVFAASVLDGGAVSVEHWEGEVAE